MRSQFDQAYQQRYGFTVLHKALIVETVSVEVVGQTAMPTEPILDNTTPSAAISDKVTATVQIYTQGNWHEAPVYHRSDLKTGDRVSGTALIIEPTGTNVIEPGWIAEMTDRRDLVLSRTKEQPAHLSYSAQTKPDPVLLEIFNNLVRAIAEEMGVTLQNTSYSVNIKERLDFSCVIFDQHGQLVANAPHIPVHLGSMSESIHSLIRSKGNTLKPGDVYVSNNPYNGGTHLPDITVISPVFSEANSI